MVQKSALLLYYGIKFAISLTNIFQILRAYSSYFSFFYFLQHKSLASRERKITLLFGVTRIRDFRDISVSCAFLKTPLAEVPTGTTKKFNMTFKFHPFFALLSRTTKYGLKGMLKPFFIFFLKVAE